MTTPTVPTQLSPHECWVVDHNAWVALFQQPWYANQEEEPSNHSGKSILDQFLTYSVSEEGKWWTCRVPLNEDTWCTREFNRFDRAIVHIRETHLELKPFPCEGHCKKNDCTARFASKEYRHAHYEELKTCEWCGKEESRQNLSRHKAKCSKKPSGSAAEGSSSNA